MKTVICDVRDIDVVFRFAIYAKLVTVVMSINGYLIYINQALKVDERNSNLQCSRLGAIQLIDKHIEELFNSNEA